MPRKVEAQERTINALLAVGRVMASTADYENALATMIETACRTVDATTGGFMVHEPESDELVLQTPAFGIADDAIVGEYRVPLSGGGNAVRTFLSGKPYVSNQVERDPRFLQRFTRMFHARQNVTVPLILGERAIGVFHVINKQRGIFTAGDVELLSLLAPLLAVAVHSARMFRAVRDDRRQLERAVTVHNELTRTMFEAAGIEPLAMTLHRLLGRPVVVLDETLAPVAAAGWALRRRGALSRLRARLRQGVPGRRMVSLAIDGPGGEAIRFAVAPIALGDQAGGFLVVPEAGRPLDPVDARAVEQAVNLFALETMQEKNAFEIERRLKRDLLRELFERGAHGAEGPAGALLGRLGYPRQGPWRVVRLEAAPRRPALDGAEADEAPRLGEVLAARVHRALGQVFEELFAGAALVPWRAGYLVLLRASDADQLRPGRVLARLSAVLARTTAYAPLGLHLALGPLAATPADLARSLEGAERALLVAQRLDVRDRPLGFEELGVYRLLLGGNHPRDHQEFVEQLLSRLRGGDSPRKAEALLATLEALAAHDYRLRPAARRLGVHENTLKYRLRRIHERLGDDPARGELRLEIELALKLIQLARFRGEAGWGAPVRPA